MPTAIILLKIDPKKITGTAEKLLEFKVQDGWEPLCRFLGESIPCGEKFPKVNDNRDFVSR